MGALDLPPLIHGDGTDELTWRRWLPGLRCHELSMGEWLPASARLVVVAPHPDDEILASGGLIATHLAQGGEVQVVAVTDGEASHDEAPTMTRETLGELRRQERFEGLRHLGLSQPSVLTLGMEDGRVGLKTGLLRERLMSLLNRDDVVVSTWEHDGHPDHDAVGQVTRDACVTTGSAFLAAPVWMWHWATPEDVRVPWRRLRAVPLSATASSQKLAALAAHHSQLHPRSDALGAVLGEAILKRAAWRNEYYFA
ncbi:PIG-L deacetylase family protein [Hydrogenophaga sp.]|uniref:PIG-L deacetylase family protein n=1 Tax=Hydrogenophaga sp. TaxID=1904254 RepID=UPI003F6F6B28